jgi:chorismate-pyruvate lyase
MHNLEQPAMNCTQHYRNKHAGALEPLVDIYRDLDLTPPAGSILEPFALPLECRRLLVHAHGMTRTLERAYGQTLGLKVLRSTVHGGMVTRQILLVMEKSGLAVEMALCRIYLEHLPEAARHLVLERTMPLGTILHRHRIAHEYHTCIYFSVVPDTALREHATISDATHFYGRRVTISGEHKQPVAEVIEISIPVVS